MQPFVLERAWPPRDRVLPVGAVECAQFGSAIAPLREHLLSRCLPARSASRHTGLSCQDRRCFSMGRRLLDVIRHLLIRRVCHASLLPGHMLSGLRRCRSLACVVSRSFAVLYGQNQATGTAQGSGGGWPPTVLRGLTHRQAGTWSMSGPQPCKDWPTFSEYSRHSRYGYGAACAYTCVRVIG
jgi:hypothetical protein